MDSEHDDHTLCIVCAHVFNEERPILYLARDEGLPVQYLCGGEGHDSAEDMRFVGFGHLSARDGGLLRPRDVLEGDEYERAATGTPWRRLQAS